MLTMEVKLINFCSFHLQWEVYTFVKSDRKFSQRIKSLWFRTALEVRYDVIFEIYRPKQGKSKSSLVKTIYVCLVYLGLSSFARRRLKEMYLSARPVGLTAGKMFD